MVSFGCVFDVLARGHFALVATRSVRRGYGGSEVGVYLRDQVTLASGFRVVYGLDDGFMTPTTGWNVLYTHLFDVLWCYGVSDII